MKRTLIRGACVIAGSPVDPTVGVTNILIENDIIAAIGADITVSDAEVVDGTGRIIIPGLVNAHMHAWQTALRGMSYDWSLMEYLLWVHRKLAGHFTPHDIHVGTLAGALNQIACGTTTLGDWCHNNPTPEHTDAAIEALRESGIRAVFLHGTPRPLSAARQQGLSEIPAHPKAELERILRGKLAERGSLLTLGMAIPGPELSSPDVAMADFRLAREFDLVVSMHHTSISAAPPSKTWELLAAEGLMGPKVNIVHANHIDDNLLKRLVGAGVTITATPEVELGDGHGDPITGRLAALGDAPSLGIDIESAISGEMLIAARMALAHQRALDHAAANSARDKTASPVVPRPALKARDALAWATIHGARAMGLESQVGSIERGKQADLVVIDARAPNLQPIHDPVVTALHASLANIEGVMIAGQWRKRDGKLAYAGLADLHDSLAASGARIAAAGGWPPARADNG